MRALKNFRSGLAGPFLTLITKLAGAQRKVFPANSSHSCRVCHDGELIFFEMKRSLEGQQNTIYQCTKCKVISNIDTFDTTLQFQGNGSAAYYKLSDDDIRTIPARVESVKGFLRYGLRFCPAFRDTNFLEIGFGQGITLLAAKELGFGRVIGVDVNVDTFNELIARAGLAVEIEVYSSLRDVTSKVGFVLMWHTLEHILQPHEFFRELTPLLEPHAILFLQVPQYYSPYICKTHHHFYNDPSIRHLLSECGFDTLEIGYDLDNQFLTAVARFGTPPP